MKKGILRIVILLGCLGAAIPIVSGKHTAPDETKLIAPLVVDLNVELVEIIARLAEIPSHSTLNKSKKLNPYYVAAIEEYFAPHTDHPAVKYMRYLGQERYLSYSGIAEIAPCLTAAPEFKPRINFFEQLPDERWVPEEANEFAKLMADFYQDADCRTFFESQQERYARAIEGMIPVYKKIDVEWFARFFGTTDSHSKFFPVIAPGQGSFNYGGPKLVFPDGRQEIYAIMAAIEYDSLGNTLRVDTMSQISTLVHEFSHSFVNPIQDAHEEVLCKGGEALFSHLDEVMTAMAYGYWGSMLNESLVRACEVRYAMVHGGDSEFIEKKIRHQVSLGFYWMPELVTLLDEYEDNRGKYPTMESFIPRMAEFYESMSLLYKLPPQVERIGPFENGSQDVDPDITELVIYFTHPMQFSRCGFSSIPGRKDLDASFGGQHNRTFTFKVKLEPETEYRFDVLGGGGFVAADGRPLLQYPVYFRTGTVRNTQEE